MRIRSLILVTLGIAILLLGNQFVPRPIPWEDAVSYRAEVFGLAVIAYLIVALIVFVYDLVHWYRNRRSTN